MAEQLSMFSHSSISDTAHSRTDSPLVAVWPRKKAIVMSSHRVSLRLALMLKHGHDDMDQHELCVCFCVFIDMSTVRNIGKDSENRETA